MVHTLTFNFPPFFNFSATHLFFVFVAFNFQDPVLFQELPRIAPPSAVYTAYPLSLPFSQSIISSSTLVPKSKTFSRFNRVVSYTRPTNHPQTNQTSSARALKLPSASITTKSTAKTARLTSSSRTTTPETLTTCTSRQRPTRTKRWGDTPTTTTTTARAPPNTAATRTRCKFFCFLVLFTPFPLNVFM